MYAKNILVNRNHKTLLWETIEVWATVVLTCGFTISLMCKLEVMLDGKILAHSETYKLIRNLRKKKI